MFPTCDCPISRQWFLWWFPRGRVSASLCISREGCSRSPAAGSPTLEKHVFDIFFLTLFSFIFFMKWKRDGDGICIRIDGEPHLGEKHRLLNSKLSWFACFDICCCCGNSTDRYIDTDKKLTSGFLPLQNCHRAHLQGSWSQELWKT